MPQPGWVDLDGQARVQGAHIDIGVDESDLTTWPEGPYGIVRVSPDGSDANDGSSWASAKRTVQAGMDAACAAGGEVWVTRGVYNEHLTLRPFTCVYGGFSGLETDKAERDWNANMSVLDGGGVGSVVTARISHTGIDGITVRNGTDQQSYAGVEWRYSTILIRNCTLSDSAGLAVSLESCSGTITDNRIVNNISGGILCSMCSAVAITNNMIRGNGGQYGAGIHIEDSSSIVIANNAIAGNNAYELGGGIYCRDTTSSSIINNTIIGNSTRTWGAGITCRDSSITVANTIIAHNSSGIYWYGGTPTLRHNCVYGNTAFNYSGLTDPTGSNGNISKDPRVASIPCGDVHIQPDSPCRDAGYGSLVQADWLDIDNQARVQGARVDIGADESDGLEWNISPVIVRVSPSGSDANDGSSWALAKRTIQAAIDTVASHGGEVWVSQGTYGERIMVRSYTWLYGGFDGTETSRSERNWARNVTVVDGQQTGRVFTIWVNPAGIDGFTVRNGTADYGAGIACLYSSPTISNNIITGNTARYNCGGIFSDAGSPIITNNVISANTCRSDGAGILLRYGSATVTNNTIVGNTAQYGKGAVYCESTPALLTNNIVAFCSPGIWNGGYYYSPILRNNCVYGNGVYDYYNPRIKGAGDISVDPQFLDSAASNYHLLPNSPCINAGYDAAARLPLIDIDGDNRIWAGTVDIGADEFWAPPAPVAAGKVLVDGSWTVICRAIVSAAFCDFFYLESDDRSSGIRVDKTAHGLSVGKRADVIGKVQTNANGERYIQAATAAQSAPPDNTGTVDPCGLTNRALGGGSFGLQTGVAGAKGLNNIGLLIRTWGRFTYVDASTFTVDDGSGASVKCIVPSGVNLDPNWTHVAVTGVSSCQKIAAELRRLVRVRKQEDILAYQ